jgi:hypothetical protein
LRDGLWWIFEAAAADQVVDEAVKKCSKWDSDPGPCRFWQQPIIGVQPVRSDSVEAVAPVMVHACDTPISDPGLGC